jgi:hypothetical protein
MLDETVNLEWVDGDPEVGQKRGWGTSEAESPPMAASSLKYAC